MLSFFVTLPLVLNADRPADLSSELVNVISDSRAPGIVAAVTSGEKTIAVGAAGLRQRGKSGEVRISDPFHIGSCTKAMTATLAATLVEDGLIDWDTTVEQQLPEVKRPEVPVHRDYWPVTLRELLSHRGGVPANVPDPPWATLARSKASPGEQRAMALFASLTQPPTTKPGSTYLYSNVGYTLAATMLEQAAGDDATWEGLMRQRIFRPLEMKSAGFGAPGRPRAPSIPWGHSGPLNGRAIPPGPGSDNPAAIAPAGAVHLSIQDWARYVRMHLNAEPCDVLKQADSFTELHKVHSPDAKPGVGYSLGWLVFDAPGLGTVLQHAGSNTMWYSLVWIVPEHDRAFMAIVNTGEDDAFATCDKAIAMMMRKHLR